MVEALCGALPAERLQVDLATGTWTLTPSLEGDGVAVIAVPSYGGRVPEVALQRLEPAAGGRHQSSAGLRLRKPGL